MPCIAAAAPTSPPVLRSAFSLRTSSRGSTLFGGRPRGRDADVDSISGGRSSRRSRGPLPTAKAYSMVFLSSRTLPGPSQQRAHVGFDPFDVSTTAGDGCGIQAGDGMLNQQREVGAPVGPGAAFSMARRMLQVRRHPCWSGPHVAHGPARHCIRLCRHRRCSDRLLAHRRHRRERHMTCFAVSPTTALLGAAIIGLAAALSLMRSGDGGVGQRVRGARVKTGGDVVWRMAVVAAQLLNGDTVVEPRIRWHGHRGHRPRRDQRSRRLRSFLTVGAVVAGHSDVDGQQRPHRPVDGHAPRARLGLDRPARGRLHADHQRRPRRAGLRPVAERCHRYQHVRRSAEPRPQWCEPHRCVLAADGLLRASKCPVLIMAVEEGRAETPADTIVPLAAEASS